MKDKYIGFRAESPLKERLEAARRELGERSVSDVVRRFVKQGLARLEAKREEQA